MMKITDSKQIDQHLLKNIQMRLHSGKLPCAVAFDIAEHCQTSVLKVGKTVDLAGIRLSKCQLGLFGYSPENKILKTLENLDPELEQAIKAKQQDNVIQCAEIWEIAKNLGLRKLTVSFGCETLKLKIKGCQLGAF